MFKNIVFHGARNERTGYGVHGSRFTEALARLVPVQFGGEGYVHVSLLDVVTASQCTEFPQKPSVLYTVWESTQYPMSFNVNLKHYDQLWVPSEWERSNAIAQGVPEEFVKVVPEGVDPAVYRPDLHNSESKEHFSFLHVGQWQPRKSTLEIVQSFLKAFPDNQEVRLYLSVDTLFPSDEYKTTEERLAANGINDSRIIPVHFEERADYIRRLQSAHVFVSCSRSEGWNLPLCEAMACGVPSIAADFGGSTEYARNALLVRVPQLKKPHGIYGNWDVPGQWGEPDYDHLVEVMRDAYDNYSQHKIKALWNSEKIRTNFSWDASAKKAVSFLQELAQTPDQNSNTICKTEIDVSEIHSFARMAGYKIVGIEKARECFVVGCWPNSQAKMDTLIETIDQVKEFGYPVIISTHYALPAPLLEKVDFVIYEKANVLSGEWTPIYFRRDAKGHQTEVRTSIQYHGVACLNAIRNAADFCYPRFDRIHYVEYDAEVDIALLIAKVRESEKPFTAIQYEKYGIRTDVWSSDTKFLDANIPRISSWEEYTKGMTSVEAEYPLEHWLFRHLQNRGVENDLHVISIPITNRYDQVDRNAWGDDQFQLNFIDGPIMNIVGISNNQYDVCFANEVDGTPYSLKQKPGEWSRPANKFYRKWKVAVTLNGELKYYHEMDMKGQNVIISMGSKALGDTLAWIPYVEEFRKKHQCNVYCSTWWNNIMDYPEIHFIKPGDSVENVYASYEVGCFDGQPNKNPTDWRLCPLQKVAADILGLDYEPIRAKLKYEPYKPKGNGNPPKNYVCFSEHSTMQNKLWNREDAWQAVINHLNGLNYDCVSISTEQTKLINVVKHNGQSIEQTITDMSGASFYIGLNHGPYWIAYSLGIPAIMITGVSAEWNDPPNPYRVSVDSCGVGCFNDPSLPMDRGWDWCPRKKNFICTKDIKESMVITKIEDIREVIGHAPKKRIKSKGDRREHKRNDEVGASPSTVSRGGAAYGGSREEGFTTSF